MDPAAFSAFTIAEQELDAGIVAEFRGVVTNIGEHFNSAYSSFVCPYSGIYMFNIAAMTSDEDYDLNLGLFKDDDLLLDLYAHNTGFNNRRSGGQFVITECTQGQTVVVKCRDDTDLLYGDFIYRRSAFTGTLLYQYH